MSYRLGAPVHTDHLIKKSRFIGCVQTVRDRAEAVVDALRLAHPGAAHVCWALMAGGQSAANDDGEPSGTAGRPMLEVLRHQDLEGVLATVVRYFGGVKLGLAAWSGPTPTPSRRPARLRKKSHTPQPGKWATHTRVRCADSRRLTEPLSVLRTTTRRYL